VLPTASPQAEEFRDERRDCSHYTLI